MATANAISKTARLLGCRTLCLSYTKNYSVWTADKIVKSPHRDVEIPSRTIPEHIWENLDKWADKTAMVCGITNHSYTYHQLHKYSRSFAAKLRSQLQIRDGDVICIMMPNSPEYALVMLGALQAGAEVTTVNPIYTAHEVQRQIVLSNAKLIIGVPETIKVIKGALEIAKKQIPIIAVKYDGDILPPGTISLNELAFDDNVDHSVLKEVNRKPEDIAFLPYSSGTTGLPKGVELTNRNIVVNCVQQDVEGVRHYEKTTNSNQDSVLGILPFFHIYGLSIILLHKLTVGYKIVTLPKFQPNTFLNALKDHRINLLISAPPLVLFLGSHKDVTKEHLANIKTITSGAAPLPKVDVLKVLEKSSPGTDFLQLYGLTETSPLATAMRPGTDNYTTSGFAISNTELRIVDSELRNLGANEVGELLIRGPQVMKGYRNNPEATKGAITEDGWLRTGDLAKIDQDGAVTIADRLKELIKVKGYQVPPAELESILKEHPGVIDAAVIGAPDKRQGEVPKAFVVLKDGHQLDAKEIMNFVAERVAEYKRVQDVIFLDDIPKNPSGKILRRVLKEKYC